MGIMPGLKAFVAAVLGGIGNIPGAVLGGLLIGVAETLVVGYLSPTYRDAIAFVLLIVILLVRPTGLLGARADGEGLMSARALARVAARRRAARRRSTRAAAARAEPLLPDDPRRGSASDPRRGEPQPRQRLHRPVLDRPRGLHGGRRLRLGGARASTWARGWLAALPERAARCRSRAALYFPLPLLAGGLAAALAGLVVGMPSLRLRGDYLAIVTLGFGEIIRDRDPEHRRGRRRARLLARRRRLTRRSSSASRALGAVVRGRRARRRS